MSNLEDRWHRWPEEKPPSGADRYLVCFSDDKEDYDFGFWDSDADPQWDMWPSDIERLKAWRPLPEPPKELAQ